jgi:uncharacterized alkaline shock family protein YloU
MEMTEQEQEQITIDLQYILKDILEISKKVSDIEERIEKALEN